jgi:sugar phosphate isomerase/epimerase
VNPDSPRNLIDWSSQLKPESRVGIASGLMTQMIGPDARDKMESHGWEHIEIHQDSLALIPWCKAYGLSFSYHSDWWKDKDQEEIRIETAIKMGCNLVIVHPDGGELERLTKFGPKIALENLDLNHHRYQRAGDFEPLFSKLPEARMCLDLGHLWAFPTEALPFIEQFGDRIAQIHLSETCRKSGIHLETVSPEFIGWALPLLERLAPARIVIEPPMGTRPQ